METPRVFEFSIAKEGQDYRLPLNFLGDGEYDTFICKDIPDSPMVEAETKVMTAKDTIEVKMNPTGGFIAHFTKKKFVE